MEIAVKINIGANAEINGGKIEAAPNALNTANANQKMIDMATAIPIPNKVPLFPIKKENGMAINTIMRLDKGNAYL